MMSEFIGFAGGEERHNRTPRRVVVFRRRTLAFLTDSVSLSRPPSKYYLLSDNKYRETTLQVTLATKSILILN